MILRRKPTGVMIEASLTWKFFHDPEDDVWVGVCEALNLNASGKHIKDLQESANEVMSLLFQDLFQDDELDAFLRDRGWKPANELPSPDAGPVVFDVPADWNRVSREEMAALA